MSKCNSCGKEYKDVSIINLCLFCEEQDFDSWIEQQEQ